MKLFKSNDSRFCLSSALYISSIPVLVFTFIFYVFWILLTTTLSFFNSQGYSKIVELQEAFYEFLLQDFYDSLPALLGLTVILFFVGYYIAKLFLRPFDQLERFIHALEHSPDDVFKSRFLFGLNPLTNYSHVFFRYIYDAKRTGKLAPEEIQEKYKSIDGPKYDIVLYFYCFVFTTIFTALNSLLIYMISSDIHENMIQLAFKALPSKKLEIQSFFAAQEDILFSAQIISVVFFLILFNVFIFTRFKKVNGPAFAFFRSMRAFMEGKSTEVFLRSYDPVHKQAEIFNQFLKNFKP